MRQKNNLLFLIIKVILLNSLYSEKVKKIVIDNIELSLTPTEIKDLIPTNLTTEFASKYPTQAPLRKQLEILAKKFTSDSNLLYKPSLSEQVFDLCRYNFRSRYLACGGGTLETWEEENEICIKIGYLRFIHCFRGNYFRGIKDEPIIANLGFYGITMGIEYQKLEKSLFDKMKDKLMELLKSNKDLKEEEEIGKIRSSIDLYDDSDPSNKKERKIELKQETDVCGLKAESVFKTRKIYVILGVNKLGNLIIDDYRIIKDPDLMKNREFVERDEDKGYFWMNGEQYYRQEDGKVFYWNKGEKVYVDEEKLMKKKNGG